MELKPGEIRYRDFLGAIPKYAGIMLTVIVSVSVVYEYCYYRIIGPEFIAVYNATDFIKLAISWIPVVSIGMIIGISINYIDAKARAKAYSQDFEAAEKTYKIPDRLNKAGNYTTLLIAIVALPQISFLNTGPIWLLLMIYVWWIMKRLVSRGKIPVTTRPIEEILTYAVIAGMLTAAITQGLSRAAFDLKRNSPVHAIKSSNFDGRAIILRVVERGIIFRPMDTKQITFVPWDDIKIVQSENVEISDESLYQVIKKNMFWVF